MHLIFLIYTFTCGVVEYSFRSRASLSGYFRFVKKKHENNLTHLPTKVLYLLNHPNFFKTFQAKLLGSLLTDTMPPYQKKYQKCFLIPAPAEFVKLCKFAVH